MVLIGNASQVVLQTANGAYATKIELEEHRTAAELDHPNKSVHKKHLAFEVYDKAEADNALAGKANTNHGYHVPTPEAANNARFLRNDNTWQTVTPSAIRAYDKNEVYNKGEVFNKGELNLSFRKIGTSHAGGNVDWNTLTEPTTYLIQNVIMDTEHHAPPNEYKYGLLAVHRLQDGADRQWRTVQIYYPHSTRGYWSRMLNGGEWLDWRYIPTQNEVETIAEQKASTRVSKSGDAMSGELRVPVIGLVGKFGDTYIKHGTRDSGSAIADKGANLEIGSWQGIAFYNTHGAKYTGTMNLRTGDWRTLGAMTADRFYASNWFRSTENGGIYWEKYDGGWYMEDHEWIRTFGGKNIYTSGTMKADGGFEGNLRGSGGR